MEIDGIQSLDEFIEDENNKVLSCDYLQLKRGYKRINYNGFSISISDRIFVISLKDKDKGYFECELNGVRFILNFGDIVQYFNLINN